MSSLNQAANEKEPTLSDLLTVNSVPAFAAAPTDDFARRPELPTQSRPRPRFRNIRTSN